MGHGGWSGVLVALPAQIAHKTHAGPAGGRERCVPRLYFLGTHVFDHKKAHLVVGFYEYLMSGKNHLDSTLLPGSRSRFNDNMGITTEAR